MYTNAVIDFRVKHIRDLWKKGNTSVALAVTERYASDGLLEAQVLLAQMSSSTGLPEDKERALHWYKVAADRGDAGACFTLWRITLGDGGDDSFARSRVFLRRAAAAGDDRASRLLIVFAGSPKDSTEPELLNYIRHHAALGEALAQLRLAQVHDEGFLGVTRDARKAFELYLLAAKQGNVRAQCCVGILYALGDGVEQSDEQAVHWYQLAARAGSAQAQCNLGYSYEIGRRPLEGSMREANRWYRRSAMRDFDVAQCNLGMSYLHGRELPQNIDLANRWFARAAQQGLPVAQCALGYSYERGRGVEVSYATAAELYAAAASAGYAQAQQNWGYMLENGFGVAKDPAEAVTWYRRAAQRGLASAQSCLASMYEHGVGIGRSVEEALAFYRLSAAQGDELGIDGVARLSNVDSTPKDRSN